MTTTKNTRATKKKTKAVGKHSCAPSGPRLRPVQKQELEQLLSARESFCAGWKEALSGDVRPVSELWDDID